MNMALNRRFLRDHERQAITACKQLLLIAMASAIAACSSGGDDNDGGTSPPPPPANQAPVANAGGDLNVTELATVNLLGSSADPDNANI